MTSRPVLLGMALAAACAAGCQGVDENPHRSAGTGTGSPSEVHIDASVPDAGPVTVDGRVCLVNAALLPDTCEDGVNGATVTVRESGALTATTGSDGSFTLDGVVLPVTVVVSATGFRDSLIQLDAASESRLPLISETDWSQLLLDLGVTQVEGDASVVMAFDDGGVPVSGAQVLTAPTGTVNPVFYDQDDGVLTFDVGGGTGDRGLALVIDVPALDPTVTADILFSPEDDDILVDVPVQADALTFSTVAR